MWIIDPALKAKNPIAQKMTKMTAIVYNKLLIMIVVKFIKWIIFVFKIAFYIKQCVLYIVSAFPKLITKRTGSSI